MEIRNFEIAQGIVKDIKAIKNILKSHTLGRTDVKLKEDDTFDFYNANLFNILQYKKTNFLVGGGNIEVKGVGVYENSDKSGKVYLLSKEEIIKLQEFIQSMLKNRLDKLEEELKKL